MAQFPDPPEMPPSEREAPRLNNRDLQQAILDTYDLWQKTTNATQGDVFYKHLNTLLGVQLIRARAGQGD